MRASNRRRNLSVKRGPVHLHLDYHVEGAPFMGPRKNPLRGTKTFVLEDYRGWLQKSTAEIKEYYANDVRPNSKFTHSEREFILGARTNLVRGETFADFCKLSVYTGKERSLNKAAIMLMENFSLANIKKVALAEAEAEWAREKAIVKTIKQALKEGKVEARYGIAHSTISAQLHKEGIRSSRTLKPFVLTPYDVLIRKLRLRKIKPVKISDIDYLRGGVDLLFEINIGVAFPRALFEKKNGKSLSKGEFAKHFDASDARFRAQAISTLIYALSERQLREIISRVNPYLVFEFNGLIPPDKAEHSLSTREYRRVIAAFLKKHSSFFNRQRTQLMR